MLRLLSHLVGQPVVAEAENSPIGRISKVVFDPAKGKVVAYQVGGGTGDDSHLLSTVDVRAYLDHAVVVGTADMLQPPDELPAVATLLRAKQRLLGLPTVTSRGVRLGAVKDATLETDGHFLVKLHIRPPWWRFSSRELIIARERVVRFESGRVVVRYDSTAGRAEPQPEVTA